MRPRRIAAALLAVASLTVLAGCSSDPLAEQYREGSAKGYISGDGSTEEFAAGDRGEPIDFEGLTDAGTTVSSADYRGEVLVVNFWYAECAPCRVEAPDLARLHETHLADGVEFLGVNLYNSSAGSQAFARTYDIAYPSIIESESPTSAMLAFAGKVQPKAVPTTLVIDREGRIAARISGLVNASNLDTLISDAVAEGR